MLIDSIMNSGKIKRKSFTCLFVDVLILYEHRSRELENACLLAIELLNRDITVGIEYINSPRVFFTKSSVVVVPHLYDDLEVCTYAKTLWKNSQKCILNLQSEQVLSRLGEKSQHHNPKGQAIFAQHIAWGDSQQERYLQAGIIPSHIHKTGHIAMDLLKDNFSAYYLSKSQIALKYGLDEKKEWVIFFSSFGYAGKSEEELAFHETMNPNARYYSELSTRSRKEILKWIDSAASIFPEKLFIYRPHPAEQTSNEIIALQAKYSNVVCIRDYSSRQWVKVCDRIFTWFSTCSADAYFAHKTFYILRPEPISDDLDVPFLAKWKHVTTEKGFHDILSMQDEETESFTFADAIEQYYGQMNDRAAYIKIADICEDALASDKLKHLYKFPGYRFSPSSLLSIKSTIKIYYSYLLFPICKHVKALAHISMPFRLRFINIWTKETYGIDNEIESYLKRLFSVVNSSNKELEGKKNMQHKKRQK